MLENMVKQFEMGEIKKSLLKGGFLYSKKGNQVIIAWQRKRFVIGESRAFSLGPIILWGFARNPAHQVYLLTLRNRTTTYVVRCSRHNLSHQLLQTNLRITESLSATATSLVLIKQS